MAEGKPTGIIDSLLNALESLSIDESAFDMQEQNAPTASLDSGDDGIDDEAINVTDEAVPFDLTSDDYGDGISVDEGDEAGGEESDED